MMTDEVRQLSLASKIVGDDEDKLKSDNLYSDEDLTLNSLGNLSHDPMEAMFEKNNIKNNMRIIGNDMRIKKE